MKIEGPIIKKEEENKQEITKIPNELEIRNFSKKYHHPGYRTGLAEEIIEAKKSGKNVEDIRKEFYEKTSNEKELFESQGKERSVSEIMREKDIVFVHGMPMFNWEERGSDYNNEVIKNTDENLKFEDTFKIITSLEPTISASIPSPDRWDNGLMKKWGIILGEGKILSAKDRDSGSVAIGLNKRIPKYENESHKHSAIQPNIDINTVIPKASELGFGAKWNEIVIEKPKVAGLYFDITFRSSDLDSPIEELRSRYGFDYTTWDENGVQTAHYIADDKIMEKVKESRDKEIIEQKKIITKLKKYSEKFNIPLYIFKKENEKINKYKIIFGEGRHSKEYLRELKYNRNMDNVSDEIKELEYDYTLIPVTAEEIYKSKVDVSLEERRKMVEEVKEKGILKNVSKKEIEQALKE